MTWIRNTDVCVYCGIRGHHRSTCHVMARGALRPDRADEEAQRLLMGLKRVEGRSVADVRRAVARALREAAK